MGAGRIIGIVGIVGIPATTSYIPLCRFYDDSRQHMS
jgi:hypothetical protein